MFFYQTACRSNTVVTHQCAPSSSNFVIPLYLPLEYVLSTKNMAGSISARFNIRLYCLPVNIF